ncbi:MAG: PPA1309 family protein [Actinomycetia bacterium]|nr:PPA1309 family protein [Actinomycetes bacterium]
MNSSAPRPVTDPLSIVALETERHVARTGWDQNPRLFALVETAHLLEHEPGFLDNLQAHDVQPGALTAVEQDDLPDASHLESMLAQLAWPENVVGAAVAVERIVLPPSAEHDLPEDPDAALTVLAEHPERRDVRLLAAVLRDGSATCLLRQREHDRDDRVAQGQDIAPGLVHGLLATFD